MTNDELTALLGSPADIPQPLEEQSTYTDDAGHRLPLPLDESFFEALPPLLTDVLGHYPDRALRTQQLLAMLTLLGTAAIHCRVTHDNREYGTALMTLIYGSPASGKGRMTELLPLVQSIDRRVREESRKERLRTERQIEAQRIKRQRMSKSRDLTDSDIERAVMSEEEIEVPLPRCHMMADNITVPAMLQYMKGSEPHALLLTASELLTIAFQSKSSFATLFNTSIVEKCLRYNRSLNC